MQIRDVILRLYKYGVILVHEYLCKSEESVCFEGENVLLESSIIDEWEELYVKGSNSDFKSIDSQFYHRQSTRFVSVRV